MPPSDPLRTRAQVRTNVDAGLAAVEAERVVQLFGDVAPEGAAEVLGLAEAMADTPVGDVPRGSFGEVRFAATGPSRKELEPEELAQFTCTLAFKDSWSGAPIGCGDGSGPRPSPWIVKADREAGGTPVKSRFHRPRRRAICPRVCAAGRPIRARWQCVEHADAYQDRGADRRDSAEPASAHCARRRGLQRRLLLADTF